MNCVPRALACARRSTSFGEDLLGIITHPDERNGRRARNESSPTSSRPVIRVSGLALGHPYGESSLDRHLPALRELDKPVIREVLSRHGVLRSAVTRDKKVRRLPRWKTAPSSLTTKDRGEI